MKKITTLFLVFAISLATVGGGVLATTHTAEAKKPKCKKSQEVIKGKCRPKNCPHGRKKSGACKPKPKKEKSEEPSHTCGAAATYFDFGCGKDEHASDKGGKNNPIVKILATIIKILTGGVGLIAIGGVVAGGIIYSTAAGNAETAKKGLSFIFNSVIGLALYAFFVAILNFAIPGGLFN